MSEVRGDYYSKKLLSLIWEEIQKEILFITDSFIKYLQLEDDHENEDK